MPPLRNADEAATVENAFRYMYRNRQHTDFRLISRDRLEEYHVHSLLLAIQSSVFSQMIYGDTDKTEFPPKRLVNFHKIENDDNLALKNMISYIYDEELILDNISNIRQTKAIADMYKINQLGKICKNKLSDIPVNASNVLTVLNTAIEFRNSSKEDECYQLISEKQEEVFRSRQFLGMPFKTVLNTFEKIRNMNMMSESKFLLSAIMWLNQNPNEYNKKLLMQRVEITDILLSDYVDIIVAYPDFFSGNEISAALKKIKTQQSTQEKPEVSPIPITETSTNTIIEELEGKLHNTEEQMNLVKKKFIELEKNFKEKCTELEEKKIESQKQTEELELTIKNLRDKKEQVPTSSAPQTSKDQKPNKSKQLTIQILEQEDGVNVFDIEKRARITIQDGYGTRSLQVAVADVLKKGLLGTVADKKGKFTDSDVNISYEGIYFMIGSLKELDETLSPIQYIEVLKAALHFQLKDLAEKCMKRISGIIDCDPLFLDGLRTLTYLRDKCPGLNALSQFKDKCLSLLLAEPWNVIKHPNFTKSSVDLLLLLLQQSKLRVGDESQLLLAVIIWIEAQPQDRQIFRLTLLKNLAWQNISTADFKYVTMYYPNFFSEKEQKLFIAFRNAVGCEVKFFRNNLPEWYTFTTRKLI